MSDTHLATDADVAETDDRSNREAEYRGSGAEHSPAGAEPGEGADGGAPGIDPRGPRFAATVTTVVLAVTLLTIPDTALGTEILPVLLLMVQALVFGAASLFGMNAQPYGAFYRAFIRPSLGPPNHLEDEAPPRFSQQMGFAFILVALIGLAAGVPILAKIAVAMALLAAFLNAVFNLCLGCELFLLWKRFSSRSATAAPDDPQDASQDEEASRDEEVPAAEVEDDEQAASPDDAEADAANQ